jgi:hypothetical protein
MTKKITDEQAYQALVEEYGKAALTRAAGLKNRQSADRWSTIPLKHARKIAEALGIPKKRVLPSEYS